MPRLRDNIRQSLINNWNKRFGLEVEVKEEVSPHIDSMVQPQAENSHFQIPKNLSKGYGAQNHVPALPRHRVRDLAALQAPLRSPRKHPLKISFCNHCGDFFARSDTLKRHRNNLV
jgi:hypothetical protein